MTSNAESSSHSAQALRAVVKPLSGDSIDFDRLVDAARHARLVLIGEASHGTHEFYRVRAEITKRLIREHGFIGVAAEADWPDAYRVNRYVRGRGTDRDAGEALGDFRRFPQWMWRNADVLDFVGWLREHNEHVRPADRVGFYGLDLYSLHASIEAVLRYLQRVDPKAAERAKQRYACFDRFGTDPQTYGYATRFDLTPTCEHEVVSQLVELRRAAGEYATRDGLIAPDDLFFAQQNARVVRNAERYYRSMFGSHVESWNLRDSHMHETLDTLRGFLEEQRQGARIVVWAHNSHLGDARETEMGSHGELNLGQLVRQQYGREVLLVGFSTYVGTVTAASDWGEPAERRTVRLALPGSYEALFHEFGFGNCFADLRTVDEGLPSVRHSHLERAIGVIYHPETERQSHYFRAILSRQFDAILHYDSTRAVEPLERTSSWERGEPPETYPSAL